MKGLGLKGLGLSVFYKRTKGKSFVQCCSINLYNRRYAKAPISLYSPKIFFYAKTQNWAHPARGKSAVRDAGGAALACATASDSDRGWSNAILKGAVEGVMIVFVPFELCQSLKNLEERKIDSGTFPCHRKVPAPSRF